ncbi:MAG TPA: hypothetical protein VEU33_10310, partial [Archangium sp.]|nr:hypothetical protein [Archangium sp.]
MNLRLPATWDRGIRVLLDCGVLLLTLAAITSTIALFGLSAAYVAVQSGQQPAGWAASITDVVLKLVGKRPTDAASYAAIVSYLASVAPVAVSIVFTVWPVTTFYRQRRLRREQQSLNFVPVRELGKDDLDVMWRYYRQAEEIIVFSGDFSWLATENSDMTRKLRQLGHRVTYVSSKTEEEVATAVGALLFAELNKQFVF